MKTFKSENPCKRCGLYFNVNKKSKTLNVYCSKKCYDEIHLIEKIKCICKNCQCEFFTSKKRKDIGRGIYCSQNCYRNYKSNNGLTENQKNNISNKTKIAMVNPEIRERFLESFTLENRKKRSSSTKNQMKVLKSDNNKYQKWLLKQVKQKINYWKNLDEETQNFHLSELKHGRDIFQNKLKDDEYKKNHIKKFLGEKNPFYGKKHSPETISLLRKKSSEILLRKIKNGEIKNFNTKPEICVQNKLKSLNIDFETHFNLKDKIYDIYIPKYKILIEVDGTFWHSKGIDYKNMNMHQKRRYKNDLYKNQIAEQNGFKLIRIWSDEVNNFNPKDIII